MQSGVMDGDTQIDKNGMDAGVSDRLANSLSYGAAASNPANELSVTIHWNPQQSDREGALWLGYLTARANFIGEHRSQYAQKAGEITPTFAEEVEARISAVHIYRELKAEDRTLSVPYFNDLDRVESNSFMREYVWAYLRQPTWTETPNELKQNEFDTSNTTNLGNHQAITKGSISFGPAKTKPAQAADVPGPDYTRVVEGRTVLQRGNTENRRPFLARQHLAASRRPLANSAMSMPIQMANVL